MALALALAFAGPAAAQAPDAPPDSMPASGAPAEVVILATLGAGPAVTELAQLYQARGGVAKLRVVLGPASLFLRQLAQGSPGDLVILDDSGTLDRLEQAQLLVTDSRRPLFTDPLAIVTARDTEAPVPLTLGRLPAILGERKLAVGEADTVVGRLARQAIAAAELGVRLEPALRLGASEAEIRDLVAKGDAAFGILHAAAATADARLKVVGEISSGRAEGITYALGVVDRQNGERTADFVGFLESEEAKAVLRQRGYEPE